MCKYMYTYVKKQGSKKKIGREKEAQGKGRRKKNVKWILKV